MKQARRKLTDIFLSNVSRASAVKNGNLVQMYYDPGDRKRGKWLSPRTLLYLDADSGTASVPCSSCRPMHVVVDDLHVPYTNDDFAVHVLETDD